jgi:hypothetical protein
VTPVCSSSTDRRVKTGTHTVGGAKAVHRNRRLDRERAVAVYLTYVHPGVRAGYSFLDRALYLSKLWTDDPGRCASREVRSRCHRESTRQSASELAEADRGVPRVTWYSL